MSVSKDGNSPPVELDFAGYSPQTTPPEKKMKFHLNPTASESSDLLNGDTIKNMSSLTDEDLNMTDNTSIENGGFNGSASTALSKINGDGEEKQMVYIKTEIKCENLINGTDITVDKTSGEEFNEINQIVKIEPINEINQIVKIEPINEINQIVKIEPINEINQIVKIEPINEEPKCNGNNLQGTDDQLGMLDYLQINGTEVQVSLNETTLIEFIEDTSEKSKDHQVFVKTERNEDNYPQINGRTIIDETLEGNGIVNSEKNSLQFNGEEKQCDETRLIEFNGHIERTGEETIKTGMKSGKNQGQINGEQKQTKIEETGVRVYKNTSKDNLKAKKTINEDIFKFEENSIQIYGEELVGSKIKTNTTSIENEKNSDNQMISEENISLIMNKEELSIIDEINMLLSEEYSSHQITANEMSCIDNPWEDLVGNQTVDKISEENISVEVNDEKEIIDDTIHFNEHIFDEVDIEGYQTYIDRLFEDTTLVLTEEEKQIIADGTAMISDEELALAQNVQDIAFVENVEVNVKEYSEEKKETVVYFPDTPVDLETAKSVDPKTAKSDDLETAKSDDLETAKSIDPETASPIETEKPKESTSTAPGKEKKMVVDEPKSKPKTSKPRKKREDPDYSTWYTNSGYQKHNKPLENMGGRRRKQNNPRCLNDLPAVLRRLHLEPAPRAPKSPCKKPLDLRPQTKKPIRRYKLLRKPLRKKKINKERIKQTVKALQPPIISQNPWVPSKKPFLPENEGHPFSGENKIVAHQQSKVSDSLKIAEEDPKPIEMIGNKAAPPQEDKKPLQKDFITDEEFVEYVVAAIDYLYERLASSEE